VVVHVVGSARDGGNTIAHDGPPSITTLHEEHRPGRRITAVVSPTNGFTSSAPKDAYPMALLRRVAAWVRSVGGRARHDAARTWRVLSDPGARPAVLYAIALAAAGMSFLLFLAGDGGTPDGVEFGLLLGSFGTVLYMSLRQAGSAPRRGR